MESRGAGGRLWVLSAVVVAVVAAGGVVLTNSVAGAAPPDDCSGEVGAGDGDNRSAACQTLSNGDTNIITVPDDPKTAFSGIDDRIVDLRSSTAVRIGALPLPPGSYAISALVGVVVDSSRGDLFDDSQLVNCTLAADGDQDIASIQRPESSVRQFQDRIPLETVHTFSSAGEAVVTCRGFSAGGVGGVTESRTLRISAVEVDVAQNVPLVP